MSNANNSDKTIIYKLEEWFIEKTNSGCWAHGIVYNNPKFRKGKKICTSVILKIETGKTEYFAHTLNSIYSLPMDSYVGDQDVQEIINHISEQNQRALDCAEKLLSEGDCLFFEYRVFYKTSEGIIRLPCQTDPDHQYKSYVYEKDDFELRVSRMGKFTVKFNEAHKKCALYQISFYNVYFEKTDYLAADMTKTNTTEVNYEQTLPF